MSQSRTPFDRRDEDAADRDAVAEGRDVASGRRDDSADSRDVLASDRDRRDGRRSRHLDDLLDDVCRRILERLTRIEDATIDVSGCPDLTAAGLAYLQTYAAEQRGLVSVDRAVVTRLLDDLRRAIHENATDIGAAARDRHAAARDRHDSGQDRRDSSQDRDDAARDRGQTAVEREQVDPADIGRVDLLTPAGDSLGDRVGRAVGRSRQRIADSREKLTRTRHGTDPLGSTAQDDDTPATSPHRPSAAGRS